MKEINNCFYSNCAGQYIVDDYDEDKKAFSEDFIKLLKDKHYKIYNKKIKKDGGEEKAGRISLKQMHDRLIFPIDKNTTIPCSAGVIVEYVFKKYPSEVKHKGHRVDYIICGTCKDEKNIILIELKSGPDELIKTNNNITELRNAINNRIYENPEEQVNYYKKLILEHNKYVIDNNVNVYSCVYLHNMTKNKKNEKIRNAFHDPNNGKGFLCGDGNNFKKWVYALTKDTKCFESRNIAKDFLNSEII